MKKKQKKAKKTQKHFDKISCGELTNSFPTQLKRDNLFSTPIWYEYEPAFVKKFNKAADPYVEEAKKNMKKEIDERNKKFGNKGDRGFVYQSQSLINDPSFMVFQNYIGATSHNLLVEMGYDLTNYQVFTTEMWVQEFAKEGGGTQYIHTHWNGHISGFYFLKTSESTPRPILCEPRSGRLMNLLPEKDIKKVTYASNQINYDVKPGSIIFTPSFLPHMYPPDMGYSTFRFIHFNCQAIPKGVINYGQR